MTLYAKSDGTTLEQHTSHVVSATEAIAQSLLPEITGQEYQIASHGAILHDLGKAHPYFQASLVPGFVRNKHEAAHRHEISSLLFLPLFAQDEWPQLIDMVTAHHKSLCATGGKRGRGLIDLVESYGEDAVFARHAEGWEDWHLRHLISCRVSASLPPSSQMKKYASLLMKHCVVVNKNALAATSGVDC